MWLDDGGKPIFDTPHEDKEEIEIDWYKCIVGCGSVILIISVIISII
jgi:hypothetical protein